MKILEQIKKANDRLIKHIEKSINLLEIDQEKTTSQSFYMFIDDSSYVLYIIKIYENNILGNTNHES